MMIRVTSRVLSRQLALPLRAVLVFGLVAMASACQSGDTTSPPAVVTPPIAVSTVSVTLVSTTLVTGQSTTASAEVRGTDGNVLTNRVVTWTSSNSAIATVTVSGLTATVQAVGTGTVTITASSEGKLGSINMVVNVPPIALGDLSVSPNAGTLANPGSTQTFNTVAALAGGAVVAFTNTSSNAAVATVAATGANPVVTAVGTGTATITISATGSGPGFTTNTITREVIVSVTGVATVQLSIATGTLGVSQTTQLTAVPKDAAGNSQINRVVSSYSSSNNTIATVNATGQVTAVGPGVATLSATIEGKVGTTQVAVCQAGFSPPAPGTSIVFVSTAVGNDASGTGSCSQPYKSVSKGVQGAASGTTVLVAPGTYNTANGEVFPINLPAGVTLLGDEAQKGRGTVPTRIVGDGAIGAAGSCGNYFTTVSAGTGSVIAGFDLNNPTPLSTHMTLVVRNNDVVIRNNTITGQTSGGAAIFLCNASVNQVISGNRIVNNTAVGIGFILGGAGSRVENNVITGNTYGIEYDSAGGDLGGGPTGSVGGNVISCNIVNDLWTNNGITINATNNFWDHVPLVGNDFFNGSGAILLSTGARVATAACT